MAKAKFFIEVDTYWENSPSVFFGPFESREEARGAADRSAAGRNDLGHLAQDVKNQARVWAIHTTTQAKKNGMRPNNTVGPNVDIPTTGAMLMKIIEGYRLFE